jgi:hypothetical protein
MMQNVWIRTTGMIVLLGLAGTLAGGGRPAAATGCSQATLKGAYVWAYDGFQVSGALATQRVPLAYAGHDVWNGDGTMTSVNSGGVNGVFASATATGTYTLNADCSGTLTYVDSVAGASHWDIYALNDGSVFMYVATDAGTVAAGSAHRA